MNSSARATLILIAILFFKATSLLGQETGITRTPELSQDTSAKIVIITGVRFSYDLIQTWIDDYNKVRPDVQIIIEARGSADPHKFDILAEVYEHPAELKERREYINVGRYAILPVAASGSSFATLYAEKGLNRERIINIFFHDIFAENKKSKSTDPAFTPYTRLQKAGVPSVFANYFGYEQKDIKGNAIAGADAHLLKALRRDSSGVTYLPVPLIYDKHTRNPVEGLTVLPVDFNGNGKVSEEEKFYHTVDAVIQKLEGSDPSDINNIPIGHLHLSVDKATASPETMNFLNWVKNNSHRYLSTFGYLKVPSANVAQEKSDPLTSRQKGR